MSSFIKKRVCVLITAILMLGGSVPAAAALPELMPDGEIGCLDFDDGRSSNDLETIEQFTENKSCVEKTETDEGMLLSIKAAPVSTTLSYSVSQIGFAKLPEDESYRISWSYYLNPDADVVFTLTNENGNSKGNVFGYIWLYKEGYIRSQNSWTSSGPESTDSCTARAEQGSWHCIEAVVNPISKTVAWYLDGNVFSSYSFSAGGSVRHMYIQVGASAEMIANKSTVIELDDFDSGLYAAEFNGIGKAKDKKAVLKFNEYPEDIDVNDITLTSSGGDTVKAEGLQRIGKKFILTLDKEVIPGKRYTVSFASEVTSAFGKKLSEVTAETEPVRFTASAAPAKLGGIFDDTEKTRYDLEVKKSNSVSEKLVLDIEAKASDSNGHIVWSDRTVQTITALIKSKSISIYPQIYSNDNRYGLFNLEITVKEVGDETGIVIRVPFSQIMSNDTLNYGMGVSTHYIERYQNVDNMSEQVGLNSKAGMGIVRDSISWSTYESDPMHQLKGRMQTFYNSVLENNIIPMGNMSHGIWKYGIGISGDGRFAGVAKYESPYDEMQAELQMQKFYDYIKDFAGETQSFVPNGKKNILEIGNEWDLSKYDSKYTDVNGVEKSFGVQPYVDILKKAWEAVQDIPDRPEIVGIVSAVPTKEKYLKVMGEYLDAGAADYCDSISLHPYYWKESPEDADICGLIDDTNALLDERNIERKPLVLSEWGSSSALVHNNNEEKQAMYAVRGMGLVGTKVQSVIWYTGQEKSFDSSIIEEKLGILKSGVYDTPCAAKPVYAALSCYNSLTADKNQMMWEKDENGTYTCEYRGTDEKVIMFWNPNGAANLSVMRESGLNSVMVYDMYGNRSAKSNLLQEYSLVAGEKPQYIVFSKASGKIDGIELTYSFGGSGNELSDFMNCGGSLTVDLHNSKGEGLSAAAIIASYSDGELVDIQCTDLNPGKNGKQRLLIPWEKPDKDIDEVKAFVWNGTKSMRPLSRIDVVR